MFFMEKILLFYSFFCFFIQFFIIAIQFIKFIFKHCFTLHFIKFINFKLCPHKIGLFRIIDFAPPKSSFHQTFNKQSIIPKPNIILILILILLMHIHFIPNNNRIKDPMCKINQKDKFSIRCHLIMIYCNFLTI